MTDQYSAGSGSMPPPPDSVPASRGPAPSSVLNAVRLMYLSAVLGIIGLIATLSTKDALRDSIKESQSGLSASELDTAVNIALGLAIVFGIVFTVLWLILANFVRKGHNWARIVTWVLAGLGVLSVVGIIGQPALNIVLALVGVVIDIAIIVLLAIRPSSDYFSQRSS